MHRNHRDRNIVSVLHLDDHVVSADHRGFTADAVRILLQCVINFLLVIDGSAVLFLNGFLGNDSLFHQLLHLLLVKRGSRFCGRLLCRGCRRFGLVCAFRFPFRSPCHRFGGLGGPHNFQLSHAWNSASRNAKGRNEQNGRQHNKFFHKGSYTVVSAKTTRVFGQRYSL